MFRILGSVDILNEKLDIQLTHHDVNWVYSSQKIADGGRWVWLRSNLGKAGVIYVSEMGKDVLMLYRQDF